MHAMIQTKTVQVTRKDWRRSTVTLHAAGYVDLTGAMPRPVAVNSSSNLYTHGGELYQLACEAWWEEYR